MTYQSYMVPPKAQLSTRLPLEALDSNHSRSGRVHILKYKYLKYL